MDESNQSASNLPTPSSPLGQTGHDDDDDGTSSESQYEEAPELFLNMEESEMEIIFGGPDEDDEDDEYEDDEDIPDEGDIDIGQALLDAQQQEGTDDDAVRIAERRRQILRLLANANIHRIFAMNADDDEEDGFDQIGIWNHRRRRARSDLDPERFPKVPSAVGEELMASGDFGSNDIRISPEGRQVKQKRLARRILDREIASGDFVSQRINQKIMTQEMIPSSNADTIIHYNEPVYSGQFSDDGNFFFAVGKDFKVRMYDTSNPYKWRYYKTVNYLFGQWTLTDASLSPDNKYLAYTSIRSLVSLAPTDPNDMGDPYTLDLSDTGNNRNPNLLVHNARRGGSFGIWSVRYSGDGRHLVAGTTGGSVVVYDIEARRPLHRIFGHEDDVNAVCFADKFSPHILYSGSDDTYLKVWDTRSMGDSREAGAFYGHIEGLTYIDSKGDGRYVLSNGKDQSMKLWDLRMVMSPSRFNQVKIKRRNRHSHFDYRWGHYDLDDWYHDVDDNSLVTFRGHSVMKTLIRCHFSPPNSTNSRYVYSGSADGKIYIWNMDATMAGQIDVKEATKHSRPPRMWRQREEGAGMENWNTCVRDASWHPTAPMIVASSWNGYNMNNGTVTTHSWNDGAEDDEAEPKMGQRLNEKLKSERRFEDVELSHRRANGAMVNHVGAEESSSEDETGIFHGLGRRGGLGVQ